MPGPYWLAYVRQGSRTVPGSDYDLYQAGITRPVWEHMQTWDNADLHITGMYAM